MWTTEDTAPAKGEFCALITDRKRALEVFEVNIRTKRDEMKRQVIRSLICHMTIPNVTLAVVFRLSR